MPLALWLQLREIIPHIVLQVWRNGALIERLPGRLLILWQYLAVWHERLIVRARHVCLSLLRLRLATLILLAGNELRLALLITRIVGLVHKIIRTTSLSIAVGLLVLVDICVAALCLSQIIRV